MIQFGLPAVVIVGAIVAYKRSRQREEEKAHITPTYKAIYESALLSLKSPTDLRDLGDAYAQMGFEEEATVLHKRARLREQPPEVQAERRKAFRTAMSSRDPDVVLQFADAFADAACFSAAANLRLYRSGLLSQDCEVIDQVIKELESGCSRAPEKGKIRSIATRSAIDNLNERKKNLDHEEVSQKVS
jgi:hypothetical protein